MPLIKQISVGMSADTNDFLRNINRAADVMERATLASEMLKGSQSALRFASGPGGGSSSGGGSAGAGLGAVGAIGIAKVAASLAPLSQIGTKIAQQMNIVGGTVVTLARRVDAAMKFKQAEGSLNNLE